MRQLEMKRISLLIVAITLGACKKEKQPMPSEQVVSTSDLLSNGSFKSLKELGYSSVEDMTERGWTIVGAYTNDSPKENKSAKMRSVWEDDFTFRLTPGDMELLGFRDNKAVCQVFGRDGVIPEKIDLTASVTAPGAPALPELPHIRPRGPINHWPVNYSVIASPYVLSNRTPASMKVGPLIVNNKLTPKPVWYGDKRVYENHNSEDQLFKTKQTYQRGFTTSQTHNTQFSKKIRNDLTFKFAYESTSLTLSQNMTVTMSESKTDEIKNDNLQVVGVDLSFTVPAGKAMDLIVVTQKATTKVYYSLPVELSGELEAYYISRNYWTMGQVESRCVYPAKKLSNYIQPESGTAEVTEYEKTFMLLSPPRDISSKKLK